MSRPEPVRAWTLVTACGVIAALAAACVNPGTTTQPRSIQYEPASVEWKAFGDSLFAGDHWVAGAPAHISGMQNDAVGGTTLYPVTVFGVPYPDIQTQIEQSFLRSGIPRRALIHAVGADLHARQRWGIVPPVSEYQRRYLEVDAWLKSLGVDVHWMVVTPVTSWAETASQEPIRHAVNDWLRTSGLDVVDCESVLLDATGTWLDDALAFPPYDGAHLNPAGVRIQAMCIADALGLTYVDEPDGPDPTVPSTSTPEPTIPTTSTPEPEPTVPTTSTPEPEPVPD